jgi:phosphoglycerate dehydrogenase-like enzyme
MLMVIADPAAPFLKAISELPAGLEIFVSDDAARLQARAPDADAILYAGLDAGLLAKVLPRASRLRWLHCLWTGVDGLLIPEVIGHPAQFTNGRGVFRTPLSDWVIAAMLFFAFDLRRVIRQQDHHVWEPFVAHTLAGRTLGIVGYGAIGSAAAARARPFGMTIAALRRRQKLFTADSLVDRQYGPGELQELMSVSDYVLVATPLTRETRGLIGETEIAAMRQTSILLNIGRGPVIDESALIRALEAKKISGAALDVFTTEPLPPDHPFWKMSNVLLSPHTADRVEGFLGPAMECFIENFNRFSEGVPLLNVVDKDAGY